MSGTIFSTTGQVTISVNKNNTVITQEATAGAITEVKIYDVLGRLQKDQRFNKTSTVTIQVGDLYNGLYFVEIISGNTRIRKNLIVQR